MLNIRRTKGGFTLVELIVVIAILAILAGTAAGIGVSLINKNTNKSAKSEVNLLVDDFKQVILEWETDDCAFRPEENPDSASHAEILLKRLAASLNLDSKQRDKISTGTGTTDDPIVLNIQPEGAAWTVEQLKHDAKHVAGSHTFGVRFTTDESFTVTFYCAVKGAIKFEESDVISAQYAYAPSVG